MKRSADAPDLEQQHTQQDTPNQTAASAAAVLVCIVAGLICTAVLARHRSSPVAWVTSAIRPAPMTSPTQNCNKSSAHSKPVTAEGEFTSFVASNNSAQQQSESAEESGAWRLPKPELHCGSGWQEDYAALHRQILGSERPPRYVATSCHAGLSDSLDGAVTAFWFAVLSGRAFQVHTQTQLRWEAALRQPHINWTFPHDVQAAREGRLPHASVRVLDNEEDRGRRVMVFWRSRDVSLMAKDHEMVYMLLCYPQGYTALADNPYHKDQLAAMGLRPATMLPCALEFLFGSSPHQAALETVVTQLEALSDPAPLKIGIHLRIGDHVFDAQNDAPGNVSLDPFRCMFACAEQLQAERARANQSVIWYVISDSLEARRLVAEQFGEGGGSPNATTHQLVVNLNANTGHTGAMGLWRPRVSVQLPGKEEVLLAAVGEMFAFSLTDFQVLPPDSAFGLAGAVWSHRWHSWFTVDPVDGPEKPCGSCAFTCYDPYPRDKGLRNPACEPGYKPPWEV